MGDPGLQNAEFDGELLIDWGAAQVRVLMMVPWLVMLRLKV